MSDISSINDFQDLFRITHRPDWKSFTSDETLTIIGSASEQYMDFAFAAAFRIRVFERTVTALLSTPSSTLKSGQCLSTMIDDARCSLQDSVPVSRSSIVLIHRNTHPDLSTLSALKIVTKSIPHLKLKDKIVLMTTSPEWQPELSYNISEMRRIGDRVTMSGRFELTYDPRAIRVISGAEIPSL